MSDDVTKYPRLLWLPDGREITVHSDEEREAQEGEGATSIPPGYTGPPEGGAVTVTALEPDTAAIGDPAFTLHVIGTGFTPDAIILFNGLEEPTTMVSDTELTTGVNMPLWQAPATVPVSVKVGDVVSEALDFSFTQSGVQSRMTLDDDDSPKKSRNRK